MIWVYDKLMVDHPHLGTGGFTCWNHLDGAHACEAAVKKSKPRKAARNPGTSGSHGLIVDWL